MTALVVNAKELLNVFCLATASFGESVNIPLTIARLELLVDISIMSGFSSGHCLLCRFLCFSIVPPIMDCFITDKHVIEPFLFSDFLSDIISPQPCLLVDPASSRLRCAEF
ncbi:unnamed protein product [Heligmosomoides polygyrus]|uniref:Secreted protein n=1 Tax=Heligmosomoides polygyrus TaxID=6339 RepID=A0A183F4T6_HELPZ|nr:unnamed protein product [Heligmosomoides polygyrus]